MKLILIRHGESARNIGLLNEDNNLTAKGVRQAIEAGSQLKNLQIAAIYCSPAKRCEQTMDEILRIRDDDFPIHLTSLVGPKSKKESFEKLKARIELFIDDLQYDHEKGDIIVVISHLLPLSMIHYLLKKKERRMENGEVVELILSQKTD